MENKDVTGDNNKDLLVNLGESPSQIRKETAAFLRRETDSLDDFEHLEHDVNPVSVESKVSTKYDDIFNAEPPRVDAEHQMQAINTGVDTVAQVASKTSDEFKFDTNFDTEFKHEQKNVGIMDTPSTMMMETAEKKIVAESQKVTEDLLGDLLQQAPPVPPHAEPLKTAEDKGFGDTFGFADTAKQQSQNFMDMERHETPEPQKLTLSTNDLADRFSDSEPDIDDFKPSSFDNFSKPEKHDDFHSKIETFKDVIEDPEPALPEKDYFMESSSTHNVPKSEPEPIKPEPVVPKVAPVKEEPKPEPVTAKQPVVEPPKPKMEIKSLPKKEVMGAEAMFCKMGLVESLIYWRDPKKSGAVFGGTLVVLLSLAYFSLISVFAYLSLFALVGTISFRIYKNVLQAVQKTADGHPFKELLEADLTLPQDKVKEISEIAVTHMNAALTELRRLFLVEDLVDSIKFGVMLWCLTYLGAWFNGMTILIIAFVALFTLPKVYENNKTQIDANLDIVRTKVAEITSKVKAAIPIGKKTEEKKEQ